MLSLPVRTSRVRNVTIADPPINNAMEQAVPSGVRWKVLFLSYKITTPAVVGQGTAEVLYYGTPPATAFAWTSGVMIGAGTTQIINAGVGMAYYVNITNNTIHFPIPDIWLYPGFTIYLGYRNQADDMTVATGVMYVEEQLLGY